MQLKGFIKDRAAPLDYARRKRLIVVMNGSSTGVLPWVVRGASNDLSVFTKRLRSLDIIYPYGHKDGTFSAPGDSGSVIGDAHNRTGDAGQSKFTEVTYVSPYSFLEECIKAFPYSHLYQIPTLVVRSMHNDCQRVDNIEATGEVGGFFFLG